MKRLMNLIFRESLSGFEFMSYGAAFYLLLSDSAWGSLFLFAAVFGQAAFDASQKEADHGN
jgi:hypothetical protein